MVLLGVAFIKVPDMGRVVQLSVGVLSAVGGFWLGLDGSMSARVRLEVRFSTC